MTARLRGVSAVSASVAWASGANGTLLRTIDGGAVWTKLPAPAGAEKLDFRDIDAFSDRVAYALSIGSGETSRIYKTTDGGASWALQFANTDPKVFLDAMAFRDADHGFAFSDSVDGQFVILATSNGGTTWERVPADRLPPALPGEGAFAASGTNVAVLGANVWIGTTASRVLRSADGGRTWAIAQTPIATGNATGIFSIAFQGCAARRRGGRRLHEGIAGRRQRRLHRRRRGDVDPRQGHLGLPLGGGLGAWHRFVARDRPGRRGLVERRWPLVDGGADERCCGCARRVRHAQLRARNPQSAGRPAPVAAFRN